jgi:hypothetical protein
MGFLDNLSKTISQGVDRAKFEADKFQKTTRLQNEVNELRKEFDSKRMEFGDRALQLYRAGQIQSTTLGEIMKAIDALQASITLKEEELKAAQAENFVESTPPAGVQSQQVPISAEAPTQARPPTGAAPAQPQSGTKACPNCQFQMPASAMFCPNCGARLGV